jgi:hypothetical protein
MTDNTNAERQRRYIARLKKAAKEGVSNAPLAQELKDTKAQLAQAQKRIAALEHDLAAQAQQRAAKPKAEKPPLPPDEAAARRIKALNTRVRNLEHVLASRIGWMDFQTTSAISKALDSDRHLTAKEREAERVEAFKLFNAWKTDKDKAMRRLK